VAVEMPPGTILGDFSRRHPELRLEIHNRMSLGGGLMLFELTVLGPAAGDHLKELSQFATIRRVEIYSSSGQAAVYRLTMTQPVIEQIAERHGLLARYPVTARNGFLRFETVSDAARIRRLLADMRRRLGPANVEAVREDLYARSTFGLTSAQEAVARTALAEGYFTVPRGITLTQLARRLGRSKSTVSVALNKIRERLIDNLLNA
jgi:predicted DNA binding protein